MQWWQRSWQFVTKPSEALEDASDSQRAALFSAILFFLISFLSLATPIFILLPDYQNSGDIFLVLGLLISFLAYGFSRSQYYRWAARIYIWVVILILTYVSNRIELDYPETVLSFLVFPIIISALILSLRETILTLIGVSLILLVPIIASGFDSGMVNAALLISGSSSLILLFANISENYRQQALDSETRYRELMNANSEGILVMDSEDARILDVNPAFIQLMGYTKADIVGRYPIEFAARNSKDFVRKMWDERILNVTHEVQAVHRTGFNLYVDITLKPYFYLQKPAYVLTIVDATARTQAERLLVESEKRFRAIFNQSFQQIGVLGRDGLILEMNDRAHQVFGIDNQAVRGKHLWDIERWADTENAKKQMMEMVEKATDGETAHQQIHARDLEGDLIVLDFSVKPVFDTNGKINMLIAESRDITAQYQAEQQRREYEHRYQALFNHTVDAVFIIGLDGATLAANNRAQSMLGATLEEIKAGGTQEFVVPEEHQDALSILDRLQTGETVAPIYERKARRKDGTVFPAEVTAMLVRDADGKPLYVQSLVRDISERIKAEAERTRLLNAIEASLNEIYIFDAETLKFQFVNAGARRNLGYGAGELLDMTPLNIKTLFDLRTYNELLEPLRQKKKEKVVFETIHERKDGTHYPIEASLQLIEFGNEHNFLAIITDTTERKKLEQEKFEFRLEQERTRVLQGFIEQASHHFRTPITNMKTSMYVLEHIQDDPEKYQQHMTALNRETERLTRLIEDLLTMLRLQKSDTEFSIEEISIPQLLGEIRSIQEGRNYYQHYKWNWSIIEEELIVVGDKQFLSRAILNILDNAVHYSPISSEISIGTYHDETWLIIEIDDKGIGISEADLPHIFEEFYRSNASMQQDSTRSGLGLAITQHIIKRHRGIVHVDSEEGEGTRFQILLPRNVDWEEDAPTLPQRML